MNASNLPARVPTPVVVPHARRRPAPGERGFGVGYGRSSGYAAPRPYAAVSSARYFRFA